MTKLCFVFNMAPKYIQGAYCLFEKKLNIKWCFGSNDTDIKEMDHSILKDVTVYPTKIIKGNFYQLQGVGEIATDNSITHYILLGEPFCLSMWTLPIKIRLHNREAKIYYWSHGWYGKESRMKAIIKKLFFHMADGILLYGNYARNLMVKEGFKAETLYTIHNSLDYDVQIALRNSIKSSNLYKDHFKNNNPTLIFIGRLTPVKRLDMILDAVCKLRDRGYIYNVVFVGDGTERESLESMTKSLGLTEYVWFYGSCYDEKTNAELIFNADLCVAPGNIGLTAMHTLVFGTPAITHNDFKWQMPEFEAIIPGITGDFFEHNNVQSLADKIADWFEKKKEKREEVRLACYKEIDENWTPEYELKVLKKIIGL